MSSVLKAAQASRQQNPPKKEEDVQAVCVEYGGEMVQCVLGHKKVRFVVRKHREVIFDFELGDQANYSVEAASDRFFCPKIKSVTKKVTFKDGEKTHIWVGREFKGELILRKNGVIYSRHNPNVVDPKKYDLQPDTKPEPLLIAAKKSSIGAMGMCTRDDPFGLGHIDPFQKQVLLPLVDDLQKYGTKFPYAAGLDEPPKVQEYVAIAIAEAAELLPLAKEQIARVGFYEGPSATAFASLNSIASQLGSASVHALEVLGGSNSFKETAGYFQEHWRNLDKFLMNVRIESAPKGKYHVVFKGKIIRFTRNAANQITGAALYKKTLSPSIGSHATSWVDGGFARSGSKNFGGIKRVVLTSASNFKSGLKIQAIGTVLDICLDFKSVFGENGSKDLSELLGRAGISIAKAGATAALGSLFAAVIGIGVAIASSVVSAPVLAVAALVIGGYILAATIVDGVDEKFSIKEKAAAIAR
jgi:hypothetical protein